MAEITQEIIDNAPEGAMRYSFSKTISCPYLKSEGGRVFFFNYDFDRWDAYTDNGIAFNDWSKAIPLPKINPVKESLPNIQCEPLPNIDAKKGEKYDQDKPRYDLVPVHAEAELVDVLTFGASKYAPNQWRKVPDAKERYTAAAMRHLAAYRMGETHDIESGKHHLAHAMCCLAFIVELDLEENQ